MDIDAGKWQYFYIDAKDWHAEFDLDVESLAGNPDVYIRISFLPSLQYHQFRSNNAAGDEHIEITQNTRPKLVLVGILAMLGFATRRKRA